MIFFSTDSNPHTDYLLGIKGDNGKTKFREILEELNKLYSNPEYIDYQLMVAGHSLGGALAQMLAFFLAGSSEAVMLKKPILAVTFASPVVGTEGYLKAFQQLEKRRKLRHLRISNENDLVPGTPPFCSNFEQTGVNLHVREGKRLIAGYRMTKRAVDLLSLESIECHCLEGNNSHHRRFYAKDKDDKYLNAEFFNMSVEELYEKYAGDFTA